MRPYFVTASSKANWLLYKTFYVELKDDRISTAQQAIDKQEPGWDAFWVELDRIIDKARNDRATA